MAVGQTIESHLKEKVNKNTDAVLFIIISDGQAKILRYKDTDI